MTKADVQGRLNRETNPIPGERPGFNPQFIDSDGYATDVTPNTPFPSGSYVQTDAGVWVPQKGNNDGAAHVQLTGSKVVKTEVTVVAEAVSIEANSSMFFEIEPGSESELWIAVNIDKQPWRIRGRHIFNSALDEAVIYPKRDNETSSYPNTHSPALSLYMGVSPGKSGLAEPTTVAEAKQVAFPFSANGGGLGAGLRLYNDSEEIATVTLKTLKVWRG